MLNSRMTKLTHGVPGGASTLLGMLGTLRAEEPSEVRLDSSLTSKIEIYPKCQSSRSHNFWVQLFSSSLPLQLSSVSCTPQICHFASKPGRDDVTTLTHRWAHKGWKVIQMSRLRPKHRVKAHQAKDLKSSALWHCESCEKHWKTTKKTNMLVGEKKGERDRNSWTSTPCNLFHGNLDGTS